MRVIRIIYSVTLLLLTNTINAQKCEHIVQRGESFESIASKYTVTVDELKKANPESKTCYVGRKLLIPFHGKEIERKPIEVPKYDYGLISSTDSILTNSAATTYQVGYANWKKRKFDTAFLYLLSAANQEESRAYYPLGDCYTQETLASHNNQIAIQWFLKTLAEVKDKSSQDYYMACLRLADCYANAKGAGKDIAQARYYYKQYSKYTQEKNNKQAVQTLAVIKREEEAIARVERDKKIQEQRKRENAYLANVRQKQSNNTTQSGTEASSAATSSATPQAASSQQFSGAYTFETTGYWGHKQTLYVQQPVFYRALNSNQPMELYFSSKNCSVIKVRIAYNMQFHPGALSNPLIANMLNVCNGWSVFTTFAKGAGPTCIGLKYYDYDNGYFKLHYNNPGVTFWLAQDLSSFIIGGIRYDYRISQEQYSQLFRIELDFLNKADAYEARYISSSSSSNSSSELSRSLQESIEECDRNIDAINRKSIERYKKEANTPSKVSNIYYAPDYTGGQYTYWCPVCRKWGSRHVHYK